MIYYKKQEKFWYAVGKGVAAFGFPGLGKPILIAT